MHGNTAPIFGDCRMISKLRLKNEKPSSSWLSLFNLPLLPSVILGILPWITLALLLRNLLTAIALLMLCLVVTGLGYLILTRLGFLSGSIKLRLAFAPAIGFVILAAYFALASRLGLSIRWIFWIFMGLGIAAFLVSLPAFYRRRSESVNGGIWLVVLSAILAITFYRPALQINGVVLENGGYTWIDVDADYATAIAASIKISSPPVMPGMYQAQLVYHTGAYAIAGFLSSATDMLLSDSMEVLHGLGLIVLFLSTIGFSVSFAKVFGDLRIAAPLGVIGMFFGFGYGWITSFISNHVQLSSKLSMLINDQQYSSYSGAFFYGHSILWGLIGLATVVGILVAGWGNHLEVNKKLLSLGLIAAHVVPLNFLSGLGCCGILAGVCIISSWKQGKSWLIGAATISMMVAFFALMGLLGVEKPSFVFNEYFLHTALSLTIWVYFGLGMVIYAFRYIFRTGFSPLAIALALLFLGYISFFCLLTSTDIAPDNQYGLFFLQFLFSTLAFIALSYMIGQLVDGNRSVINQESMTFLDITFRLSKIFSVVVVILLALILIKEQTVHPSDIFYSLLPPAFIFLYKAILALSKYRRWFLKLVQLSFGIFIVLGLLYFYSDFVTFSLGRSSQTIYLSPGEYNGLLALRNFSSPSDIIATNKHDIPERPNPGRSYQYISILERRLLLEGYASRERDSSLFQTIQSDNNLLFSTFDSKLIKKIVSKYGIDFIVCRPDTNLQIRPPLPSWLMILPNTGSLTIYEVLQ